MRGEKTESAVWIWKRICIFAVEEINSNLHKSMKTKSLLVTAFVLFAMGTSFAQSKKTMDMLKEKYGKDVIAYQHGKGSNSCYLIKMGYSGMEGICDKKGQIIVPMKYDNVFLWGKGSKKEPYWYKVKLNYKEGVCDATGTEIIPPIYGNVFYNSDQGVFRASGLGGIKGSLEIGLNPDGTAKGTYKPLPGHDEKGLALFKHMEEKYGFAYRGGEGTSENPFYFIVKQKDRKGICDETGREVIPPKYDNVTRVGGWMWGNSRVPLWYSIKQNGKVGACDLNGREIIPPIYDNIKNKGFYYTEFNGKEIRIDLNNPEVVAKEIYKNHQESVKNEKTIAQSTTQERKPQVTDNDPTKAYNIGKQYYNEKKYKEAIPWLKIAKEKYKQAYFPLAISYHSLPGEDNHEQAYWNYGHVIGHPECFSSSEMFSAYWWLAFFKEDGVGSISKDLKGALFFFEQARKYANDANRNSLENNITRIKRKIAEGDTSPRQNVTTQATSPTSSKTPQTTSKSGNTNSQTTNKDGLLYSGTYTISGEEFLKEENRYIEKGKDEYLEIKIYKYFILVKNSSGEEKRYDYNHTIDGWKVYQKIKLQGEFFTTHIYENYIVNSKFDVGRIDRYNYTDENKVITYMKFMEKGRTKMPRHKNN